MQGKKHYQQSQRQLKIWAKYLQHVTEKELLNIENNGYKKKKKNALHV